jgi:hypothetical protein
VQVRGRRPVRLADRDQVLADPAPDFQAIGLLFTISRYAASRILLM